MKGLMFMSLVFAFLLTGCLSTPQPIRMDVTCVVVSREPVVINCADSETWKEWPAKHKGVEP